MNRCPWRRRPQPLCWRLGLGLLLLSPKLGLFGLQLQLEPHLGLFGLSRHYLGMLKLRLKLFGLGLLLLSLHLEFLLRLFGLSRLGLGLLKLSPKLGLFGLHPDLRHGDFHRSLHSLAGLNRANAGRAAPVAGVSISGKSASSTSSIAEFQMITDLSEEPEATWSPLGLQSTLKTSSVCPSSV